VSIVQIQFQEAKENGGFEEKIQIIFWNSYHKE
jgi:hypothetical protein